MLQKKSDGRSDDGGWNDSDSFCEAFALSFSIQGDERTGRGVYRYELETNYTKRESSTEYVKKEEG